MGPKWVHCGTPKDMCLAVDRKLFIIIIIMISPQLSTAEHRPPLERTTLIGPFTHPSALLIQCSPAKTKAIDYNKKCSTLKIRTQP